MDRRYAYYRNALAERPLPCGFVDLDRLERNADAIAARADGTPVRVATKSVRCRAVLERIRDHDDAFRGFMCYSGREAAFLADRGFDDLLVAYPVWHEREIKPVCEAIRNGVRLVLMVDSLDHVDRLSSLADRSDATVPVCLDVDLSTRHLGVHFGVRRSGVRTPESALAVCDAIADRRGLEFAGVMGYEAQLAGIPDDSPAKSRAENWIVRALKRRSRPQVVQRRRDVVRAIVEAGYEPQLVNGGGTGTVEFMAADPAVTEITVGSGFFAPALFDHYRGFRHAPAAGFAIEVTRRPASGVYTCRGGGYVASGPPGEDREPVTWHPEGAELRPREGAGEVQTPVRYDGPVDLSLGDPVFFRHAKAGELCERVAELHLIADGEVVETVPTYRGEGRWFL